VGVRGGQQRWLSAMAAIALVLCAVGLAGGVLHERNNIPRLIAQARPLPISANDEVVALRISPFGLAFYMRHHHPIRVVEDWDEPLLLQKDSWRRELHEAAGFDPARAQAVLTTPQAFARLLACSRQTVWVFASKDEGERQPDLARLQPIAAHGTYAVWRRPPPTPPGDGAGCEP
jgi:hypothetical protein